MLIFLHFCFDPCWQLKLAQTKEKSVGCFWHFCLLVWFVFCFVFPFSVLENLPLTFPSNYRDLWEIGYFIQTAEVYSLLNRCKLIYRLVS